MARTITNGNTCDAVTVVEVKISADSKSTWTDIADRTKTLTLEYDHGGDLHGVGGSGRWIATAEIVNTQDLRDASKSLDPGHTSDYNPAGVPLLGAYHDVKIAVGKGAAAATIFEGYVGPGMLASKEDVEQEDVLTADFVDIMQPYADFWIDRTEGRTYADTYISSAANALNAMLGHYGFAKVVVLEDDPSYYLYRYEIGDTSLLDALQRPIHSIGYAFMTKWSTTHSAFRPTIVDPNRSNTTADTDMSGNLRVIHTTYSEANVRTRIRWVYRDRTTGKEAHTEATDATALSVYGIPNGSGSRLHRYMRIVEKEGSVIDTRTEAATCVNRALHDLSKPCPGAEVTIPWLALGIEGGDLVQFTTHSETVKVGVTGIRHTIDVENKLGQTTITGTLDYRVGNRRYWFLRGRTDLIGQYTRDGQENRGKYPDPPSTINAEGVWGDGNDASAAPQLLLTWGGSHDWTTSGYEVRYCQAESRASGTSTSGGTCSLTDTAKSWNAHEWMGCWAYVGTSTRGGEDQLREIIDNDTDTLKWRTALDTAVTTESYRILKPTTDWQVVSGDRFPVKQVEGLPSGVYVIAMVRVVPYGIGR